MAAGYYTLTVDQYYGLSLQAYYGLPLLPSGAGTRVTATDTFATTQNVCAFISCQWVEDYGSTQASNFRGSTTATDEYTGDV